MEKRFEMDEGCLFARGVLAAGAVVAFATTASGAILGHEWVEVDNSVLSVNGQPSGLADGGLYGNIYRTFDLYITTDTPLLVLDSGVTQSSGVNPGLSLSNSSFFQQDFFGSEKERNAEPLLEFDSFVGLGERGAADILETGSITFTQTAITGTWSIRGGDSPVAPNAEGRVFFGRFTVESELGFRQDESATRSLGGTVFAFPEGADLGTVVEIDSNPFAIPAPGGTGVVLIAGAGLLRRRRN